MIKLLRVHNPLEPSQNRETRELDFIPGRKLRDYLIDARVDADEFTVSLNGEVPGHEAALECIPVDGNCIGLMPRVLGGSVFRTLGSIAVLIGAAALVATGAGAALGAFLLPSYAAISSGVATAVGSAILSAAVTVGGNLLVNAIANALTPSSKTPSPSYAPSGPKTTAQSGTVIPKGYGTFTSGGNVIASFVDVEGKDQYFNVLVCYGFGPATAIDQVRINGKDIGDYGNVQYYTRLGANDQQPIANFNRVVNGYPQATQCLAGVSIVVPGTGTITSALQVDIQFPDGVFVRTSDNNIIEAVVTYQVQYAVSGTGNWQSFLQPRTTQDLVLYHQDGTAYTNSSWVAIAADMPPTSGVVYAADNGPHVPGDPWIGTQTVTTYQPNGNHSTYQKTFRGTWQPSDPLVNQVLVTDWTDGYIDYVGASTQVLYNRTSIYGLPPGKYDVRITKYGSARIHDDVQPGDNTSPNLGQDVWVHAVNEISYLDLAYPNMILVGVRGLSTGQLSGSNLNITARIHHGLRTRGLNLHPAALAAYEDDNPACVAADMMLDRLYGGGQWPGITLPNINRYIDEWLAWANLNDELVDNGSGISIRRAIFNGIFDSDGDLWSALGVVTQMSRAAIIPIGRDYGVFIDAPDVPVQLFTMGNTTADSFNGTFLELDARANQVEIEFADATRNYQQDNPIAYMDPAQQDAGVAIKNTRVNAKGVTDPAQAWHLARYRQRSNQFLLRTGSLAADVSAVASRPGNVVILQNDVPQWGWGGRTLPGSTAASLVLDRRDLDFAAGGSYSVVVLLPSVLRSTSVLSGAGVITDSTGQLVGTQVACTWDNSARITRAVIGGGPGGTSPADCLVITSAPDRVTVKLPAGFVPAAGMSCQLYDTDVLITAPVAGVTLSEDGQAQILALSTPLPQAPPDFSTYFYGAAGQQKLVRITAIRKLVDFKCKIEWVDYDEDIYVDAVPTIGETSAVSTSQPGVLSLTGGETITYGGGSYVPMVQLAWKPGPNTVGASVFAQSVPPAGAPARSASNALPVLLARLPVGQTSFSYQAPIGQTTTYTVVGYDAQNEYASFASSPSVQVTLAGVTNNLLMGSNFSSGFTFWNITPRAGDTFTPVFDNDSQANYVVAGSALTGSQRLIYQVISPAKWSVGQSLMLSAYFTDISGSGGNAAGKTACTITFLDASNNVISVSAAAVSLGANTTNLSRCNTPATVIPANTAAIAVSVDLSGTSLNIPVGTTLVLSHLLLEIATAGQTQPSEWADIDVNGAVLELFNGGSSTALRSQASLLPSFTGSFSFNYTDTSLILVWSGLTIFWPDGAQTIVPTGTLQINGLTASTLYFAFVYYDIVYATITLAVPTSPVGSPALLSIGYDAAADAACKRDGRVALSPGGLQATTGATGSTPGSGTGGGSGGGTTYPKGGNPVSPKPGPPAAPKGDLPD